MKIIKFMAMFAAAVAVGASFAGVDSYLYYMVDKDNLEYGDLAGEGLAGTKISADEDYYAMVSADGGKTYLTLYSVNGVAGSDRLDIGETGRAGFSSSQSFTSFLFEVYDFNEQKIGWTTLAYNSESDFIYRDPSKGSSTSKFVITQLIPEPTSGLLLLLGAAGLALRRRRMARA